MNLTQYAANYAHLSKLAYKDKQTITSTLIQEGYVLPEFIDVEGTQLFIAKKDGEIVISFRGTEPHQVEDIFADIRCKQISWIHGKVHQGFFGALTLVEEKILQLLPIYAQKKIVVTGHSLGGALAKLFSFSLKLKHPEFEVNLITFGAPKVGNKDFITAFERILGSSSIRVVNDEDIVAKVPTCLGMDYHHSEKLYYLDDEFVFQEVHSSYVLAENGVDYAVEMIKARTGKNPEQAMKELLKENAKELVQDHLIDSYINGLEESLKRSLAKKETETRI